MKEKVRELALKLLGSGLTIGTVEHCTSGLLGAAISSVCGTSTIYKGTIVAVDEEHMEKLLDVSPNVYRNNGLISSQVACQMALGGLYGLNCDICVATVGDVVPLMSQDEKPKGIVWICVATMNDKKVDFEYKKVEVDGLRGRNIETVINEALGCILEGINVN